MLRCIADATLGKSPARHTLQVLDEATLIKVFIHLVAHSLQGIQQTASLDNTECSQITFLLFVQRILDIHGGRNVLGGNHLIQLVDDTVEAHDVTLGAADGMVVVDIDTVGIGRHIVYRQLVVNHVGQREFLLVLLGEASNLVILLVGSVNNGVVHNHLAYGVEFCAIDKSIP